MEGKPRPGMVEHHRSRERNRRSYAVDWISLRHLVQSTTLPFLAPVDNETVPGMMSGEIGPGCGAPDAREKGANQGSLCVRLKHRRRSPDPSERPGTPLVGPLRKKCNHISAASRHRPTDRDQSTSIHRLPGRAKEPARRHEAHAHSPRRLL